MLSSPVIYLLCIEMIKSNVHELLKKLLDPISVGSSVTMYGRNSRSLDKHSFGFSFWLFLQDYCVHFQTSLYNFSASFNANLILNPWGNFHTKSEIKI